MSDSHAAGRFFHVAPKLYEPGDALQHGRYGSAAREFRPGGPLPNGGNLGALLWEMALETARQAIRPDAVSRLNCLFGTETLEMARAFRDQFRPGSVIYEIEPWPDATFFRGDFGVISEGNMAGSYLEFMPPVALRYWRDEPGEKVEVLIGGAAWVRSVVETPSGT